MERELTCGTTTLHTVVNGTKIRSAASEFTNGQTAEDMRDLGSITICMAKVSILGKMEEGMMENTLTTESMDMAPTLGRMEDNISACGQMASNMEKEYTDRLQVKKEEEYGKRERESNGLTMKTNDTTYTYQYYIQIRTLSILIRFINSSLE